MQIGLNITMDMVIIKVKALGPLLDGTKQVNMKKQVKGNGNGFLLESQS
jgi:hypothetical protein